IAVSVFAEYAEEINSIDSFNAENAKGILMGILEERGLKIGQVMQSLRIALTGKGSGPDLMEIMEILGKKEVEKRILKAIEVLPVKVNN
ncbi:MAG: glutamate--tRNA ligase, partial [Fulvivirga sp.]